MGVMSFALGAYALPAAFGRTEAVASFYLGVYDYLGTPNIVSQ